MCSDLIAGTHGRGFWILDDVTPLRQAAEIARRRRRARRISSSRRPRCACASRRTIRRRGRPKFRPARIRRRARLIDYYLAGERGGPGEARDSRRGGQSRALVLERQSPRARHRSGDRSGEVQHALPADIRRFPTAAFRSTGPRRRSRSSTTSRACIASTGICASIRFGARAVAVAAAAARVARCRIARMRRSTRRGRRRARTPCVSRSTARRTRNRSTLKLDPRVKTPAIALTQLFTLTRTLYDDAANTHAAAVDARALVGRVGSASGTDAASVQGAARFARAAGAGGTRWWSWRRRRARWCRRGGEQRASVARCRQHERAQRGDGDAERRRRADGGAGNGRESGARRGDGDARAMESASDDGPRRAEHEAQSGGSGGDPTVVCGCLVVARRRYRSAAQLVAILPILPAVSPSACALDLYRLCPS